MPDNLELILGSHTRNPFAVFAPHPIGVFFAEQERGEKIILLLRAHLITLVPPFLITIFLFFVPFLLSFVLNLIEIEILDSLNPVQVFLLIVFWYLFTFGFAFYKFIFWYFNVYLLTNERVVDFDFRGILHKETSYAKLNQIQDVTPKSIGFFATFFHFGNVFIQTAGTKPEFEFHHVPRPDLVARLILEEVRKEEGEPPGVIA